MLDLQIDNARIRVTRYGGPERRRSGGALARWYELMLDEIDYGVLLLGEGNEVLHANHTARRELGPQHPLQLLGRALRAARAQDVLRLHDAVEGARRRGLRRLILLGEPEHCVAVSVVPLVLHGASDCTAVQVSLGKRQVCAELSIQGYARAHGLTHAETRVLERLSEGLLPAEIAERHGVGISTIRS